MLLKFRPLSLLATIGAVAVLASLLRYGLTGAMASFL